MIAVQPERGFWIGAMLTEERERGGAAVVVRARESRAQGEERQRVIQEGR